MRYSINNQCNCINAVAKWSRGLRSSISCVAASFAWCSGCSVTAGSPARVALQLCVRVTTNAGTRCAGISRPSCGGRNAWRRKWRKCVCALRVLWSCETARRRNRHPDCVQGLTARCLGLVSPPSISAPRPSVPISAARGLWATCDSVALSDTNPANYGEWSALAALPLRFDTVQFSVCRCHCWDK